MKQGRMLSLLLAALLAIAVAQPSSAAAAARKSAGAPAAKRAASLRQFTGVVTELDKASLTVEKSGREAKRVVFTRHPEMKTTGELAKDARVTVWYRDEQGHAVAHKVVVKTAPLAAER
jgi:hypothetical protein